MECVNLQIMPNITFTINGLPYTLQPTAYTLPVRTVSSFRSSQSHRAFPTRLPLPLFQISPAASLSCTELRSLREGRHCLRCKDPTLAFISCSAMKQQRALDEPLNEIF